MRHETVTRIGASLIVLAVAAAVFAVIQIGRPSGSGWVVLDHYTVVIENREPSDVVVRLHAWNDVVVGRHDAPSEAHTFRVPAASWVALPTNHEWTDIQRTDGPDADGTIGTRWGPRTMRVFILDRGQLDYYEQTPATIPPTVPAIETSPYPSASR